MAEAPRPSDDFGGQHWTAGPGTGGSGRPGSPFFEFQVEGLPVRVSVDVLAVDRTSAVLVRAYRRNRAEPPDRRTSPSDRPK